VKISNQSGTDYSKIPCLHIHILNKIKDQKSKCKTTNENSKSCFKTLQLSAPFGILYFMSCHSRERGNPESLT